MNQPEIDHAELTANYIAAWFGYALPQDAVDRIGPDMEKLITCFRAIPAPGFDTQMHHFAPLLEALADV
jgi:hypothetical protein